MYLLYSILLTIGILVMLPRFVVDAFRHGKYVEGWRQRLGGLPYRPQGKSPVVWLHCVSVGETQAARTLVQSLRQRFPNYTLVVSTITLTGQRVARELFKSEASFVFYFPFDWGWTVRRSLNSIRPDAVVIMETELWPNFLRECHRRQIPVAIVNGRLSERSFRRFQMIRRFASRIVNDLGVALMQTEDDAARIRALGLPNERVTVTGNLKFDAYTSSTEQALSALLRDRFGFGDGRTLIVAASTHEPEDRIVIDAFKQLKKHFGSDSPRILIAPRHPERFAEVAALLRDSDLSWSRRSEAPGPNDSFCEVVLLDSIGELRAVYPLAEIVFVGGSIASTGGHNILEPIEAGKCVVTGAHTFNFAEIIKTFVDATAVVQLRPVSETEAGAVLASTLIELITNESERQGLVTRASAVLRKHRGATNRTVALLEKLLT